MESKMAQFGTHQVDVIVKLVIMNPNELLHWREEWFDYIYIPASLKMMEVCGATTEGCNGGHTTLIY